MSSAESIRSYQEHVQTFNGASSIFNWEDPIRSATAFGECLVLLAIFQSADLLRLVLRLCYLFIGITALTEIGTKFLNGGNAGLVSAYRPSRLMPINKDHVEYHANMFATMFSEALYWVRRVVDARDLKLTGVSIFFLWFTYCLTAVFPVSSILSFLVIGAFTIPATYTRFRTEIDHMRGHLGGICTKHYHNYQNQIATATQPHLSKVTAAWGNVFGGAAAAAPAAAAPSVRSMKAPSVRSVHTAAASIKSAKPASMKSVKPASVRSMKSSGGGANTALVAGGAALGGAALGAGAMAMMGGGAPSTHGSVPASVYSGGGSAGASMYGSDYSYEDEGSFADHGSYAGTVASAVH
ncbi:hypothetical protein D0Z00_003140 [Geotrichum galactomycetum]|uniref:Uncharacterized protein n=1 Tax=Geotrichum galactomycetum TaxID=27317 RepID=A0ACB6V264_9ASCO|nr:hypothetical protein D0Z00_003140 [Geotrichum candidum]